MTTTKWNELSWADKIKEVYELNMVDILVRINEEQLTKKYNETFNLINKLKLEDKSIFKYIFFRMTMEIADKSLAEQLLKNENFLRAEDYFNDNYNASQYLLLQIKSDYCQYLYNKLECRKDVDPYFYINDLYNQLMFIKNYNIDKLLSMIKDIKSKAFSYIKEEKGVEISKMFRPIDFLIKSPINIELWISSKNEEKLINFCIKNNIDENLIQYEYGSYFFSLEKNIDKKSILREYTLNELLN